MAKHKSALQLGAWILAALLLFLFFNFVPLRMRWNIPAAETTMVVLCDAFKASSTDVPMATAEETEAFLALLTAQPFRRLKTAHRDLYADEQYVYFQVWNGAARQGLHVVLPSQTYGDGFAWTDSGHLCLDPAPFYDLARSYLGT